MKELDLSNATVLKWILGFKYHDCEIEEIPDICSLTRKTLLALLDLITCTCFMGIVGSVLLCIGALILSPLTLFLPTTFYASLPMMQAGIATICLVFIFIGIAILIDTLRGKIPLVPSYLKVKSKGKKKPTKPAKVKETSKTMLAIKEMYKAFKDKTCIKVKL